ncbi:MAG: efflux RND transporter permease subunit [Proteobacteria bacterium]|nr:efflux RND transporter permease subunit [Pseudomonadota bacterium]
MNLADLSIKRPIFITCIVTAIIVLGVMSMRKLGVDLFPDVTFPIVTVTTVYPGAGPAEVETLVSKVFEEEISTVSGIKRLSSRNSEGVSIVIAEFNLETDVKYAEQQIRDRVSSAKIKLPTEAKESIIRRIDPADQPILVVSLSADMPAGKLYDLASEGIRPRLEQINQVGLVSIQGGRKREIRVELDRNKLRTFEISASQVVQAIKATGMNIPAGKVTETSKDIVYRTLGEFQTVDDVAATVVSFIGNDVPVRVGQLGRVIDDLEDEKTRSFVNGEPSLFLRIYRQSGANTIRVVEDVKKRVNKIQEELSNGAQPVKLEVVQDGSKPIRANVDDVTESIFFGIILTIIVVFYFLGSGRSTIITGLALPNSLLGAFILMAAAGFTINVMTLLALSLSVGLLIDDAIVVRENIFRHIERGESPIVAASKGTKEVMLAVIGTTLAVIAVFGPIAFLSGVVGQFFKQFGLTICFAMAISLFDALTVAPMLSAYFAGASHKEKGDGFWSRTVGRSLEAFNRFQNWLETKYEKTLQFTLQKPKTVLLGSVIVFLVSLVASTKVPKTFLGAQDMGEFSVGLDMPPGTSLGAMAEVSLEVEKIIHANPEVKTTTLTVGNDQGEANVANFYVELVSSKKRKMNTSQFKAVLREQLKPFARANPTVKDVDMVGVGQRPFNVNIIGNDLNQIVEIGNQLLAKLKTHPGVQDPDINFRPGKPEFQVSLDKSKSEIFGVSSSMVGAELRTLIEGSVPAVFREGGREYDVRVRLQEDQRDLKTYFKDTFVPNVNFRLVKLSQVASPVETTGPSTISRQDRGRYVQVMADLTPGGVGMGGVMKDVSKILEEEIKLPEGVRYAFVGQAESFQELIGSVIVAVTLSVIFIYLVLASLYESFITPFTIMLVLPLAACGAFYALFMTGQALDINSMIGCILLLGVASKNSILLVDCTQQLMDEGMPREQAIVQAGKLRLRPILMTTFALIAGMLPVAIGLNEASKQRTNMGIAIIGGLISSTFLSLVVVPAAYSYIDRFKHWSKRKMEALASPPSHAS